MRRDVGMAHGDDLIEGGERHAASSIASDGSVADTVRAISTRVYAAPSGISRRP